MTKPVLTMLFGAVLASAWWAVGTGTVTSDQGASIPVFLVCLFGTLVAIAFVAAQTVDT